MMLNNYRLKDGSIYWRKLYYAMMPKFMTARRLPGGGYNRAYYLLHPFAYFVELFDNAKWFIQRGYRGYADCDAWSLDYYLAGWMPAALKRLENNKIGCPCGMTPRGWRTRLRIMRDGFEAARAMGDIYDAKQYRQLKRRLDKGLKVFSEHYLSLWD